MDGFDADAVAAEIGAAFEAYERALGANDIEALAGFFWDDPRSTRLGPEGGFYGHAQITAFRRARDVSDTARELFETRIVALTPDLGTATTEYRRLASGRRGAQSQVWMRRPEGWRIVSAHVSLQP
ncbi:DUF3225 domain-containing protein (plasmid) [Paroceanicella profunda]|uniref:DUF3225 domain-containing protein n=1 Tax=Paroceanicella profunda TaxID=2579971 RepID=A0A5B8G0I2_9RHOB|nr:AtzH-like domain-containing protein [Paroceanicella profunda]QDL94225.1 DUF3225 domain-containing protein [Paroceanicella profunda]